MQYNKILLLTVGEREALRILWLCNLTILLCSTSSITFSIIWVVNFGLTACPQDEVSFTYQSKLSNSVCHLSTWTQIDMESVFKMLWIIPFVLCVNTGWCRSEKDWRVLNCCVCFCITGVYSWCNDQHATWIFSRSPFHILSWEIGSPKVLWFFQICHGDFLYEKGGSWKFDTNTVGPRFTNLIRSWRPFVNRNVRKPKLFFP
jgi:hypothetical protein